MKNKISAKIHVMTELAIMELGEYKTIESLYIAIKKQAACNVDGDVFLLSVGDHTEESETFTLPLLLPVAEGDYKLFDDFELDMYLIGTYKTDYELWIAANEYWDSCEGECILYKQIGNGDKVYVSLLINPYDISNF